MFSSAAANGLHAESDADLTEVAVLVGVAAVITLLAVIATGLRFTNAMDFFAPVGGAVLGFGALNLYQRLRLPNNKRSIFLLNILIMYFVMSVVFLVYQYAMALIPAYRISDWVHDADAALGFDWLGFSQTVHGVPDLSEILALCYQNWIRETFLMVIVLSYYAQFSRLREFTVSYLFTGMAAISFTGLFHSQSYDALIAYSTAGAHVPTGFTHEVFDKAERLRNGFDHTLDFSRLIGLVCFPSFHAGAALLMATAMRGVKGFGLPFLAFSVMILIGTITEGGHNLADVIGGCALAILGLAAANAYLRWGGAWPWLRGAASRGSLALGLGRPTASQT